MADKRITCVIGHKNPDTDSICSAIGMAEYKRAEGVEDVFAARAGEINPQTDFILDYFGSAPPKYLPDVYTRAKDIMSIEVRHVYDQTPLAKVMDVMREGAVRFVPVLGQDKKPSGVITLMDLAKNYILASGNSRVVETSINNVVVTLKGELVLGFKPDEDASYSIYVGAMARESFQKKFGAKARNCAVVVGDRVGIQEAAIDLGVGLLIISGGFRVKEDLVAKARKNKVSIVVSSHDTATTALLVRFSTPASKLMSGDLVTATPDDLSDELKTRLSKTDGLIVTDDLGRMLGVVTKSSLLKPSNLDLILVDHNELSQAVDGASGANITCIIDHHRIGALHTTHPISFICEPVGSTSTIVSELFARRGFPIKKETAGLLLGGVLSDTVMLKSPTTTGRDRSIVDWLSERSGVDYKAFGAEVFAATSGLKARGSFACVNDDYKVFEAKGKKFGLGQVETIGLDGFWDEKQALYEEVEKLLVAKGLVLSGLIITDIVLGTSLLLATGEKKLLVALGYPQLEPSVFELKNVISRKQQVVPHLLRVMNELY